MSLTATIILPWFISAFGIVCFWYGRKDARNKIEKAWNDGVSAADKKQFNSCPFYWDSWVGLWWQRGYFCRDKFKDND